MLTGEALGIVETSRSWPRVLGVSGGGGGGEVSLEKRPLAFGGGDWSVWDESQLFPSVRRLASLAASGKGWGGLLVFSHAARVAGSTGHTSAGVSVSLDILLVMRRECVSELMMLHNYLHVGVGLRAVSRPIGVDHVLLEKAPPPPSTLELF